MIATRTRPVIQERQMLSIGIDDRHRLQQPLRVLMQLQELRSRHLRLQSGQRSALTLRRVDRGCLRSTFIDG